MPVKIAPLGHMDQQRRLVINVDYTRNYTRIFRCVTTDARIGAKAVGSALHDAGIKVGIVYKNDYSLNASVNAWYEDDVGSWAQSITIENESTGDGRNWLATVEYGPLEPIEEDPISRDVNVAWNYTPIEEIVDEDLDGKPVVNTAYDAFDPPLTRESYIAVATFTRNENAYDYDFVNGYQNARNSDVFLGKDPGYWICKITGGPSVTVHLLDGTDASYWPVNYELSYHPKGWDQPVINQGMRQLNTAKTGWEPIAMHGQPVSSPALLDKNGRALAPNGDPVYLEYKTAPSLPFKALNFKGIDFGKGPIP